MDLGFGTKFLYEVIKLKGREVFGMLEDLSSQDAKKREEVLLEFAKGVLELGLDEFGVRAEMTDDGINIKYDIDPVRKFPNLAPSWAGGIAPTRMIPGFRVPYDRVVSTEMEHTCAFLSYCAAVKARLRFLDWLSNNHKILFGLGLVIDTVDWGYVFLGTTEKHEFLAKLTDMRTPGQDYVVTHDGIDGFFDMIEERDNAQIIAIKRRLWRDGGIDVQFTSFEDGKCAVSANIHNADGSIGFRDWPTSKEACEEIDKIYAEKFPEDFRCLDVVDAVLSDVAALYGGPGMTDVLRKAKKEMKETFGGGGRHNLVAIKSTAKLPRLRGLFARF